MLLRPLSVIFKKASSATKFISGTVEVRGENKTPGFLNCFSIFGRKIPLDSGKRRHAIAIRENKSRETSTFAIVNDENKSPGDAVGIGNKINLISISTRLSDHYAQLRRPRLIRFHINLVAIAI